jgi:hypothetical protein
MDPRSTGRGHRLPSGFAFPSRPPLVSEPIWLGPLQDFRGHRRSGEALGRQAAAEPSSIFGLEREGSFGADFTKEVRHLDIEEVLSAPRSPWQRASIERVIGSIRRECIDHVIVFNEAGLYRYRNIRASNSNGAGSRNSIWENSA